MEPIPLIKTVMRPFPYKIEADETVLQASHLMLANAIHHLPVIENQKLVGVISDRDIKLVSGAVQGIVEAGVLKVADVCTPEVYEVELNERLDRVLQEMASRHIGSAVVVKEGHPVGIFTLTDACRLFSEYLRRQMPPEPNNPAA